MDFKKELENSLKKVIKEDFQLELPKNKEFGDFSLPCFKLNRKPEEFEKGIKLPDFIEKIEIKGAYLNFYLKQQILIEQTLKEILKEKELYGSSNQGKGKKALIEHTSINPNASPHIGRSRNAIIGDAIAGLFKFEGYNVETHYYVNDIGKQIAMLVLASEGKKVTFNKLLGLYVEFNKKLEKSDKLEKEIFSLLSKLEKGDLKTKKQFKDIVDVCIKGQSKIMKELGIEFDYFDYESKFLFNKGVDKIIELLKKTNKTFIDDENRLCINLKEFNLPMKSPILPLTRSDGTSMYMLRDVAYTIEKLERSKENNILVLGEDQKLYFQQLKALLSLLKKEAPRPIHYSFVLLNSGKMSTRKGHVVLLEDFMKEIENETKQEIKKRKKTKVTDQLVKIIAHGALKFALLKVSAERNVNFNLGEAISFETESSPYVQYAYVRAMSVLKKAKKYKYSYSLPTQEERGLIKKLAQYPEVIKESTKNLQVHNIVNYSLELAKIFNEFYQNCPVLTENEEFKNSRLTLVEATTHVLKSSLKILGINCPDKM